METQKYKGKIIVGTQDGRKINMRTANLEIYAGPIESLEFGVYASIIKIDKNLYKSITHYGPRLVFSETTPKFEVHIFNFQKEIYGEKVEVELKKFIRETQKFDSLDDMMNQIHDDIRKAKDLLQTYHV